MIRVKICGLRDTGMIESAARFGADRIGLVVVPTSPRAVTFEEAHRLAGLIHSLGREPWIVARLGTGGGEAGEQSVENLLKLVRETPAIAAVQLHGGEAAYQVADFKALLGPHAGSAPGDCRIVKAHGVAAKDDLDELEEFEAADALLLDAKPPADADREGGFGEAFDWSILEGFAPGKPWVLSGGLTPENVAEAIAATGAREVDVSSGVESKPGIKDVQKVRDFIRVAKQAG